MYILYLSFKKVVCIIHSINKLQMFLKITVWSDVFSTHVKI